MKHCVGLFSTAQPSNTRMMLLISAGMADLRCREQCMPQFLLPIPCPPFSSPTPCCVHRPCLPGQQLTPPCPTSLRCTKARVGARLTVPGRGVPVARSSLFFRAAQGAGDLRLTKMTRGNFTPLGIKSPVCLTPNSTF